MSVHLLCLCVSIVNGPPPPVVKNFFGGNFLAQYLTIGNGHAIYFAQHWQTLEMHSTPPPMLTL